MQPNLLAPIFSMHGYSGTGGRVANAGTPADYRLLTVANSPARKEQEYVYGRIDKYITTFNRMFDANADRIKSLFLWSESPGTGKTTTAIAVLNEWMIAHYLGSLKRERQAAQTPAYFLDCNDWQTLFNEFNRSNVPKEVAEPASREYYRRMHAAKTAPFVVIDDLGVRDATTAFRGDLHSVINHRTTNAYPTVFTSNLPIEEMATVFDQRLYDRVRDQCAVLYFSGESHRGRR
jgi:DNA replication protein DnaC